MNIIPGSPTEQIPFFLLCCDIDLNAQKNKFIRLDLVSAILCGLANRITNMLFINTDIFHKDNASKFS